MPSSPLFQPPFVGREPEEMLYQRLLSRTIHPWVLLLTSQGGVGKSILIRRFASKTPADVPAVMLDFARTSLRIDPLAVLEEIFWQIDGFVSAEQMQTCQQLLNEGRAKLAQPTRDMKQEIHLAEGASLQGQGMQLHINTALLELRRAVHRQVTQHFCTLMTTLTAQQFVLLLDASEWLEEGESQEIGQWLLNEMLPTLHERLQRKQKSLVAVISSRTKLALPALQSQDMYHHALPFLEKTAVNTYLSQIGMDDTTFRQSIYEFTQGYALSVEVFGSTWLQYGKPSLTLSDLPGLQRRLKRRPRSSQNNTHKRPNEGLLGSAEDVRDRVNLHFAEVERKRVAEIERLRKAKEEERERLLKEEQDRKAEEEERVRLAEKKRLAETKRRRNEKKWWLVMTPLITLIGGVIGLVSAINSTIRQSGHPLFVLWIWIGPILGALSGLLLILWIIKMYNTHIYEDKWFGPLFSDKSWQEGPDTSAYFPQKKPKRYTSLYSLQKKPSSTKRSISRRTIIRGGLFTLAGSATISSGTALIMKALGFADKHTLIWTDYRSTGQLSGAAPALIASNNTLYMAFVADDLFDKHILFVSSKDSVAWTNSQTIIGSVNSLTPALAVLNNTLYMAFVDADHGNELLIVSSTDGYTWAESQDSGKACLTPPALTVLNNTLYMAFIGANRTDKLLVVSSADGRTWTKGQDSGQVSLTSPALAVLNDTLYMAFADDKGELLITSSVDGVNWSNARRVGQSSLIAPSLATWNDTLYMAFVDTTNGNELLLISSPDGIHWTASQEIWQSSQASPALAVLDNVLCIAFKSNNFFSSDTILFASANG